MNLHCTEKFSIKAHAKRSSNLFVTGGAKGIGKSVATAFAEAGADIAIVDVDIAEAEKTAKELANNHGVQTLAIKTDVTKPEEVDAMVSRVVETFGRPDELQAICVYLAGDASSFTTGADFVIDGAFTCF